MQLLCIYAFFKHINNLSYTKPQRNSLTRSRRLLTTSSVADFDSTFIILS